MYNSKELTAADQCSDWLYIPGGRYVDVSVAGTFVATVTLQRSIGSKTDTSRTTVAAGDGEDVEDFVGPMQKYFFAASSAFYRIGIKAGNFTSGSADNDTGIYNWGETHAR